MILSLVFSLFALASEYPGGRYSYEHEILESVYQEEGACLNEGGRWDKAGRCWFAAADTVSIEREGAGYFLTAITITDDQGLCYFSAPTLVGTEGSLVASAEGCNVEATLLERGGLSLRAAGNCSAFCNGGAKLEIERAETNRRRRP